MFQTFAWDGFLLALADFFVDIVAQIGYIPVAFIAEKSYK